jgi:hypothetical protein
MKVLLLAAWAMVFSTAGQACTLSDNDVKALVASPSHLTQSEFSTLPPERQELVCSTRAFIKQIDAQKGVMKKMEKYSTKYLSSAENDRMIDASNALLAKIFKSTGL